jgi:sodium/proline symporter
MLAALLAVPLLAWQEAASLDAAAAVIVQRNPALLDPFSAADGSPLGVLAIVSLAAWGLGYFGQPHILARFKAVRRVSQIGAARRIAVSWVFLSLTGAILVGLAGIGLVHPPLTGDETEKVFLRLVEVLFHPLIAGLCLAAVLAAIMSTADSQLLVASAAFTEDLYRKLLRRQAGQRELVHTGRLAVLAVAVVAFLMALDPESKVLDLVAYAWAGFGAAFGPTLLLALYWRRMTRNGALAGVVVGGLTVVLWKQLEGGVFDLYEIVPGVLFSALTIVSVSLLGKPPLPGITEDFDRARRSVSDGAG